MEELIYTDSQCQRIKEYLDELYQKHGVSSSLVIQAIRERKGQGAAVPERTNLDKIRRGETRTPVGQHSKNLWEILHTTYARPLGIKPDSSPRSINDYDPAPAEDAPAEADHSFFEALSRFYDVHKHRNSRLVRFLTGRFVFYHYSEMLTDHENPPRRAIVVGQYDISAHGQSPAAISVSERQAYDGRLGRTAMTETFMGYCLPKGSNLCFVMRGSLKETPKFYTFDSRFEDEKLARTTWMGGYMLKPIDGHRCFHSPVYAERVPDGDDVKCNVVARSEIDRRILMELDRAQPVRDW